MKLDFLYEKTVQKEIHSEQDSIGIEKSDIYCIIKGILSIKVLKVLVLICGRWGCLFFLNKLTYKKS